MSGFVRFEANGERGFTDMGNLAKFVEVLAALTLMQQAAALNDLGLLNNIPELPLDWATCIAWGYLDYAGFVQRAMRATGARRCCVVGSGTGYSVGLLNAAGIKAFGVDPRPFRSGRTLYVFPKYSSVFEVPDPQTTLFIVEWPKPTQSISEDMAELLRQMAYLDGAIPAGIIPLVAAPDQYDEPLLSCLSHELLHVMRGSMEECDEKPSTIEGSLCVINGSKESANIELTLWMPKQEQKPGQKQKKKKKRKKKRKKKQLP